MRNPPDTHEDRTGGSVDRTARWNGPTLAAPGALFAAAFAALLPLAAGAAPPGTEAAVTEPPAHAATFAVHPVGWVRKSAGRTFIEIDKRYQPALLGVESLKSIWVLYWFDRNDTPEKRSILQVHPRGNPDNPLRGVFATRSPFRPNLIALSQVGIVAVRDNIIEIDDIDAYADTPVLDLKP